MVFYILCAYCCRCRPHPTVAIPPTLLSLA
eukprot:COSAG05_NODE_28612_length_120_cov_302.714286_1_plen_29_part_10